MSALFLAIPLTILCCLCYRFGCGCITATAPVGENFRKASSNAYCNSQTMRNVCASAFRRWKTFLMQSIRTGESANGWNQSYKKLWRMPQKGMVRGVCAGIADYLDVPVKLVRILVVLSIFFGLAFFTVVAYIVLSFVLDPMPDNLAAGKPQPTSGELLDTVDRELAAGEKRLREMERYVTSDTFTLRSRFRQL